jgi:hypothetical protein
MKPRVVVYGPPLAGKTTLLKIYANERRFPVERFETQRSDEPVHDRGVLVRGDPCEIVTMAASVFNDSTWPDLLHSAAAVVLIIDGQATRATTTKEFVTALQRQLPLRGCVVWTKLDLQRERRVGWITRNVLTGTPFAGWKTFDIDKDNVVGICAALDWVNESASSGRDPTS